MWIERIGHDLRFALRQMRSQSELYSRYSCRSRHGHRGEFSGLQLHRRGVPAHVACCVLTDRLAGRTLLSAFLYGVGPADPLTFGGVLAVLDVVAFAATFLPAWRVARVDPARALREQ